MCVFTLSESMTEPILSRLLRGEPEQYTYQTAFPGPIVSYQTENIALLYIKCYIAKYFTAADFKTDILKFYYVHLSII